MSGFFTLKELKIIENAMTVFYETTGVPCVLLDNEGREIVLSRKKTSFCASFRQTEKENELCLASHHNSGRRALGVGETYISFCPAGLVLFTSAITSAGNYKGALIAGPVLFDIPDMVLFRKLMMERKLDMNRFSFLEMYYHQVMIMDVEKGRRIRELMDIISRHIHDQLLAFYDGHEGALQYELSDPVTDGDVKLSTGEKYPAHLEKDLGHYIRHNNKVGVRKVLNEILGYIYLRCEADLKEVMMMVLQVAVLMTRSAMDTGISYDRMAAPVNRYVGRINDELSTENTYRLVKELLDELMDTIFPKQTKKNSDRIIAQKIASYIQNNYNTGLTLEEVAAYVKMNPAYLSRFIKKHLGANFTEYVNNIRVEFSKEYLESDDYSIIDIALMMGFTDQSYYSKVFKKYAGMTPGKYRKMMREVPNDQS